MGACLIQDDDFPKAERLRSIVRNQWRSSQSNAVAFEYRNGFGWAVYNPGENVVPNLSQAELASFQHVHRLVQRNVRSVGLRAVHVGYLALHGYDAHKQVGFHYLMSVGRIINMSRSEPKSSCPAY